MKLQWSKPADDGGRAILRYNLYRGWEVGTYPYNYTQWDMNRVYETTDTPATQWIVKGLLRNTRYSFKICGVNSLGEGPFLPAISLKSDDTPNIINLAYLQPTAQSSQQITTGNAETNPHWGSNGASSLAVDGLTNPDFRLGQSSMTGVQMSSAPWWRVQFAGSSWVTEVHLFMCSVYMPLTQIDIKNCKSTYFSVSLYADMERQTKTWSTVVEQSTALGPASSYIIDNGYRNPAFALDDPGVVDMRLGTGTHGQRSTPQTNPHLALKVGAKALVVELKSTQSMGRLAFSEVRVFGWKRGCNEEYTCDPNGGTCLLTKYGVSFRKCVCNNGWYGESCQSNTPDGTPTPRTSAVAAVGRDMSAVYVNTIGYAILVIFLFWMVGFVCLYGYWKMTGFGMSSSARVEPSMEDEVARIRSKYVPGHVANGGRRTGGSSAAKAVRKSQGGSMMPSMGSFGMSPAQAASRSQTRRQTEAEFVTPNPGNLEVQIGREPPCGMEVGLWRVVKDRYQYLLGCGVVAGAVTYLLVIVVNVLADGRGNHAA